NPLRSHDRLQGTGGGRLADQSTKTAGSGWPNQPCVNCRVSACRASLTRASGATAVDSTKVALRAIVMRTAAAPQVRSRERLESSTLMVVSLTCVLDRCGGWSGVLRR